MIAVAQRGSPDWLLVETRLSTEGVQLARIYNVRRREMSREQPLDSILKFGYWTPIAPVALGDLSGVRMLEGY